MKKRVLAIDDDEDILNILDIILQDEGIEPSLFSTGIPVEQIVDLKPDLILLGVRIAGYVKTGSQICGEIKQLKNSQKIPVVLVSAEANLAMIAAKCEADGFISKPFDIFNFVEKVKEFLSSENFKHERKDKLP